MAYAQAEFRGLALRLVPPYVHLFETHAKQRWWGRTVLDVYEQDFLAARDYDTLGAIRAGCIRVNGAACAPELVLLHGDVVSHPTHRHEPPTLHVRARDMVLLDDGDLLVVEKPPSVPVHAGGQYNRNSLVAIFQSELGLSLRPVHRLDRLVGGLVLFARTAATARRMTALLSHAPGDGCRVQKTYVARVQGRFAGGAEGAWRELSAPIAELDARRGRMGVCFATGKPSLSRFALLRYCAASDTSLVQCEPLTGRTHQLRLHLQHLGHPIPNDPLYGPRAAAETGAEDEEDAAFAALVAALPAPAPEGDPELVALALRGCHLCAQPPRFPACIEGIFLHSVRVRRFERGRKVFEFQGRLPRWAEGVELLEDEGGEE